MSTSTGFFQEQVEEGRESQSTVNISTLPVAQICLFTKIDVNGNMRRFG